MKVFKHKRQTWGKAKCERLANRVAKDGLGTPYPFKGYIGSSACRPTTFGLERYNGGCVREGEWYEAEFFPFPKLAKGFKIIHVTSWGWRIAKA